MARPRKKKKALLIEPNYSNKFPPVGLMKIATYFKMIGWEVIFYKGDLKMFVIERIVDRLVEDLNSAETTERNWHFHKDVLTNYIKTRKNKELESLKLEESEVGILLSGLINDAKDYYWKNTWKQNPEWDFVGITTLFTFYWKITIETIEFAKFLVKDQANLMVGGVLASIQPKEIEAATGIKPHTGILGPGGIHKGNKINIDELELDYSILDEIDYQYPMANAYYSYTTRGCIRKCPFCAVPTLEPIYQSYIPLKERIERIDSIYGPQKDLLLMDNNVLASEKFPQIIEEIVASGFGRGAIYKEPNRLEIAVRNLANGVNDRAYIKKTWRLIDEFYSSIKGDDSFQLFKIRDKYHIDKLITSTKEKLIEAYEEIAPLYAKYHRPGVGKRRYVDFNQGVDARLFTPEKVELLSRIAIRPLRIAFDNIKTEAKYTEALRMSVAHGLKDFSNYLLYNFDDHPDDLYNRLKINVDLSDELGVSIYSFPMKYHPIRKTDDMEEDYSHNRDYIGKHWNRKYIRAIQAVLNSTKGKIGRGKSFFEKAFGQDINAYHKLLEMPETMIIYRFFFEWLGSDAAREAAHKLFNNEDICRSSTKDWWLAYNTCKETLNGNRWEAVLEVIHKNEFEYSSQQFTEPQVLQLLAYYENLREAVIKEGTPLYLMKQEYDLHPTLEAKRHGKKNNK